MNSPSTCRHCQRRIIRVNFSLGARWLHQPEGSTFMDNTYEWCRITSAGPPNPPEYTGESSARGDVSL